MSFLARFAGHCGNCDGPIRPGDVIRTVDLSPAAGFEHVLCPDPDPVASIDLLPGEKPCGSCHLVHKGECY